jgi:hypothetical protein
MTESSQATQAAQPQSAEWWKDQNFIKTLFSSLKSISDPNTTTTIGPDGTITTKTKIAEQQPGGQQPGGTVTPQQAAQVMSAVPQSSGPMIPQGVFDPAIMNQLLAGQQQQQQTAMQVPQALSGIAYQKALTDQAMSAPENSMRELLTKLSGQMIDRGLQGSQAQELERLNQAGQLGLKAAPGWEAPGEAELRSAQTGYYNRMPAQTRTGSMTEYQKESLFNKDKEMTRKESQAAGAALNTFLDPELSENQKLSALNNFYQTYPRSTNVPILEVTKWGDDLDDIAPMVVDLAPYTVGTLQMIAQKSGDTAQGIATKAYRRSKATGVPVKDLIGLAMKNLKISE